MKKYNSQYQMMTETPVQKLILRLSIPTIISMLVTNIYNLVDTGFVGTLGNSASGAIGVVFGFMAILQAIGFMFGQGAGSMLSRKLGEKDTPEASKIASTGFFSAFTLATIVGIFCMFNLTDLVYIMGSTPTIAPYAKTYIFYILLAAPFATTSFTLNNFLRYEGKATLGTIGLMTGAILNICGDAILMFGFHLGIAGAGISTCISQIVSFSILISMFLRKKTQIHLSIRNIDFSQWRLLLIMSTGFPSLLRQGLNSITTILLNSEAKVYGDAAVSAMSIVSRIMFFTFSFAVGIGQGYQPVCAFNYGAKKYERVKKGYWFTFMLAEAIVLVLMIFVQTHTGALIYRFRHDATVVEIGSRALRLQNLAQILLPFCMTTEMMYQSSGHKLGATFLSATRSGLFFIPLLIILSKYRGLAGIQEAQPLAFVLSIIPAMICARIFFVKLNKEQQGDS